MIETNWIKSIAQNDDQEMNILDDAKLYVMYHHMKNKKEKFFYIYDNDNKIISNIHKIRKVLMELYTYLKDDLIFDEKDFELDFNYNNLDEDIFFSSSFEFLKKI